MNGFHQGDFGALSDEEENPFEAFAMTQASQGRVSDLKAEVNRDAIQRDVIDEEDIDLEEIEQRRHAQDARQHAEEGVRFRATQMPKQVEGTGEGSDEFDDMDDLNDADIDELFRRTVLKGLGSATTTPNATPRRQGMTGSVTPTTMGSGSGDVEARRWQREKRLREQAGLGDLSTIMDRSSVPLSSPTRNPFDTSSRSPTKERTPIKNQAAPTPLTRNLFARTRPLPSPTTSPSKRYLERGPNTIVLRPGKRSLARFSRTPDEDDEREGSPTPAVRAVEGIREPPLLAIKPKLKTDQAYVESSKDEMNVPSAQPQGNVVRANSETTSGKSARVVPGKRKLPSPTLLNDPGTPSPDDQCALTTSAAERALP